jgi:hypothetical protein
MKRIIPIVIIILCLSVLPAAAVIQEVTVSGTVSALSRADKTLTIANPAKYGCSYPAGGEAVCSYTPMDNATLTGSVPVDSTFSIFSVGDPIVATSLGGAGGRWITIAKLSGTAGADGSVTDIVGDVSSIPAPLTGDYSLTLSTEPDCTTCSGTTCTAATTYVKILSGRTLALAQDIAPGHAMTYSGRNDGSSIAVTFVKGQASSSSCAGRSMMTGPQEISVYIVHVVPPIGSSITAAPAQSAAPSGIPPQVTMPAEARPTPTKSGILPFAAIGALALVATVLGAGRRE